MVLKAKYPGTCKKCSQPITPGDMIIWEAGQKGVHEICPALLVEKPVPLLDLKPVADFLQAARDRGLKFPKARFLAPDGQTEMRLSLAGSQSSFPGSVQVKLGDAYLGGVKPTGEVFGRFLPSREDILKELLFISTDPAAAAKKYGAVMCRCSFCGLQLTDEGSVEVGYGPICAKKWGLPHNYVGTPALKQVPVPGTQTSFYGDPAFPSQKRFDK